MRDLDAVLGDLLTTRTALDRAVDPDERAALRDRMHELRAEAAAVRGPAPRLRSDQQLRADIANCRRLLAEIAAARYDPSAVGGSERGGGLDPVQTARHNRAVDERGGRAALEAELQALLDEVRRRRTSDSRSAAGD